MSAAHAPVKGPLRQRGDVLFIAGIVCGVGILAWVVITMQSLSRDLSAANSARDQLARQVQQLGASPVAGPPGSRGAPGQSVTGPEGPPGQQGVPGKDAPTVTPSPGPRGVAGKPGPASTVPGPAGSPGAPGADSTVAGPAGPAGPAGKDGTDGKDGTNGTNGQPPAGWTYTDPAGVTYTCSRVSDFDPSSPEYACSPDSVPSPSPTSSGLLSLGVLTASAGYRKLI